jgi:hypothetical protein
MDFLPMLYGRSHKITGVERRTSTWELRESCLQIENARVIQLKLLEGVLGKYKEQLYTRVCKVRAGSAVDP